MPRAIDIMTVAPIALDVTSTVGGAVQLLQDLEIRHVPIVNDQNELVGMVSDRDLRALSIPHLVDDEWLGAFRTALETPISQVMSADVISVEEETETNEIIDLMLEQKIGAVPVVNAEGSLVGIVSYVDLLRELSGVADSAE